MYDFPITKLHLPNNQFVEECTHKYQIVWHHSAGWDNVRGMFDYWASNPQRVATPYGINDYGVIFEGFPDEYWAHHLYIRSKGNKLPVYLAAYSRSRGKAEYLEKISVGIEIANFGPLLYRNKKFYTWVDDYGTRGKGVTIPDEKVYDFGKPFRGYRFYEAYTDNEVGALKVLTKAIANKYNIPLDSPGDIFQINPDALAGRPGIYTHCSYRTDKTDVVPQKNLVNMLKTITV